MSSEFDIRGKHSDKEFEKALRPLSLGYFRGQEKILSNVGIFVQAAKKRGESLDHVLLYGFLKRTPRGHEVTDLAYKHLGRSRYGTEGSLF